MDTLFDSVDLLFGELKEVMGSKPVVFFIQACQGEYKDAVFLTGTKLLYKSWPSNFFKEFHIILKHRKLEICKHSIFLIIDEIVF